VTSAESEFPDYANPPVTEVIFAVSFRPLPLSVVDLARFGWEHLGESFPLRQDQPPLQMTRESFDGTAQSLAPTLALLTGPPPIRLWFQSDDKTRLVQVQRDWLACNWQGASSDRPYPRYEPIEGFFLETWDSFSDFIGRSGHGPIQANQCELSYINHIVPNGLWERHGQLSRVIRLAGDAGDFLPEPEGAELAFRYRIRHQGRDLGRLYVEALPGVRQGDRLPIIQLNMVARGAPVGEEKEGLIAFFRVAHEWIVNGFAAVTTDEAQSTLWGRLT
jgi:uncharacterized protein (TIGR04255 family)